MDLYSQNRKLCQGQRPSLATRAMTKTKSDCELILNPKV